VTVITHGCRSNLAEADALERLAAGRATVINSCAVTAAAVGDARSAALRAARSGPVVVTGCAAAIAPERFAAPGIRLVDNRRKLDPAAWGRPDGETPQAVTRRSRGFVAVQDGCDHDCTFCVTRLARGPVRSVPVAEVVAAVRGLVAAGTAEVVLTGIDTGSWGRDFGGAARIGDLVEAVLRAVPELPRLRLSSLDVADADPALIDAFAEPRLMPHLHLAMQSGDDLVLKRMKRRHLGADAVRLVQRLRAVRPDIAIGADLIAGFPTEDEDAHRRSLDLLDACDIVHAHVFPFSARPGTAAARMPAVAPDIARRRAAELRAAAGRRHRHFLDRQVGDAVMTVSEGARGISPGYAFVRYRHPRPRGRLVPVMVAGVADGMLTE
jgi:threonylcarbamoyladenosine tRNA methylthiotransferase MtaB